MLSLHVHVFIRDCVLAYVSGLSCMACFFLFIAHEGCMHLEANIYAFCFNTLLVLSLYSVVGERDFLFILKAELAMSRFLSKSKRQYWLFQEFYFVK